MLEVLTALHNISSSDPLDLLTVSACHSLPKLYNRQQLPKSYRFLQKEKFEYSEKMNKAQLYSTANALQTRDAAAALSFYCDDMSWSEDCDVLDVGCGSGDVTFKLLMPALKRCNKLTAVDVSPSMVKFASARHQHPILQFQCLDIETSNIRPRALFPKGFNKIFSFYCLHWIRDQRRALSNMFELLLPGGELLVVFLASNPLFSVYEKLSEDSTWSKYMTDASKYVSPYQHSESPEEEFREYLKDSGFEIKDCRCKTQHFAYPSVNSLKNAIQAVNPFLDRIPSELHADYINDFIDEFSDMGHVNSDGTVSADYRLMVAFAKKMQN